MISTSEMPVLNPPFYKTDVLTDYALGFLDEATDSGKPFFLYLPYHVAHCPLQAREEDIAKLYDLAEDPTELENLAGERPEDLAEAVATYHRWIRDQDAEMPLLDEVGSGLVP